VTADVGQKSGAHRRVAGIITPLSSEAIWMHSWKWPTGSASARHSTSPGWATGHAAASTQTKEDGSRRLFRPLRHPVSEKMQEESRRAASLDAGGAACGGLTWACYSQDPMRPHPSAPRHPSREPAQRGCLVMRINDTERACYAPLRGAAPLRARWTPGIIHIGREVRLSASRRLEPWGRFLQFRTSAESGLAPFKRSGTS